MWNAFFARAFIESRKLERMLSTSDEESEKRLVSFPIRSEPLDLNGDGQSEVSTTSVILEVIGDGVDFA